MMGGKEARMMIFQSVKRGQWKWAVAVLIGCSVGYRFIRMQDKIINWAMLSMKH